MALWIKDGETKYYKAIHQLKSLTLEKKTKNKQTKTLKHFIWAATTSYKVSE